LASNTACSLKSDRLALLAARLTRRARGLLASARWHTRGKEILYCAPNPATAELEILVHSQVRELAALARHRFIKADIPDEVSRQSVDEAQLPTDWCRRITVTRA
jgi:RES domain-containing protein